MGELESHESNKARIVAEILGDAETFPMSTGGPNGPWHFETLDVRRKKNIITVRDVDGEVCDRFHIDALAPANDEGSHKDMLRGRLERLNEETLDEL